jgi:hypothetical protein
VASKARIDIEARDKASQVFDKVQRSMGDLDERASALSSGFSGVGEAFGLAGLAGTGLVTALAASVKSTADFNDAMGKAAQRAGVATEEFSKLAYAAGLSDVSVQELQKGLQLLGQDAANGGKKLSEFGIELRNVDGSLKSNDHLLREVADRISRMATPAEKSAAAVRLLGEEGARLVPLLNSGAQGLKDLGEEAGRFGQVVTDEAAEAAAKFNDNLLRIQSNISGMARQMSSELIPALAKATSELLEGSKQANGFWNAIVTFGTINPFRSAESNLKTLREKLSSLEQQLATPSRWRLSTKGLEADIERVRLQIQFLESRQARSAGGGRGDSINPPFAIPSPGGDGGAPPRPPRPPRPPTVSASELYMQNLQRQLEALDSLTVKEQLLRDIGMGRLRGMTEAQRRDLLGLAEAIDLRRQGAINEAAAEAERKAIIEARRQANIDEHESILARNGAHQRFIETLLSNTPTGRLEEQRRVMQLLADEFERGALSAEQFAEASQTFLGSLSNDAQNAKNEVQKLNMSFTSAFEDAVLGGGKVRDMLSGIAQDIAMMAFRRSVSEPLSNALNSIVGRIFSFDGGGYTGSGARMGGLDGKGGYLAILHPQETVIDHTKGQSAGRSVVVNQSFNFNGPADQALVLTAAQLGAAMGRQAIYDDMARGRMA